MDFDKALGVYVSPRRHYKPSEQATIDEIAVTVRDTLNCRSAPGVEMAKPIKPRLRRRLTTQKRRNSCEVKPMRRVARSSDTNEAPARLVYAGDIEQ